MKISKSSHLQMFFKIGVPKIFANFTEKHLCLRIFEEHPLLQSTSGDCFWISYTRQLFPHKVKSYKGEFLCL